MTLKCLLCPSDYFLMPVSNKIPNKSKHSKPKVLLSEAGQCSSVSACQKDTATTWQSKGTMRQYDSGVNHDHASKVPSNVHLGMAVHLWIVKQNFQAYGSPHYFRSCTADIMTRNVQNYQNQCKMWCDLHM